VIVRAWKGFADTANAEAYPRHLLETVVPKLTRLPGFRGWYLLRRAGEAEVEYQVLTLWDSMAAIREFAGPHPERAVVEPEAQAALVRYDTAVQHYEVVGGQDHITCRELG
jgi:heme-degrading monooxygenase HmoA